MFTKLIRRALIASGLVIGAAAAFSPTAFAEDLTISGNVTPVSNLNSGTKTATNLDLNSTATAKIAAGMSFTTNHSIGATLTVEVTTPLTSGTSIIPTYVDLVDVDAGAAGAFTTSNDTASISVPGTVNKDMFVRYVPGANRAAGSYSGLITLTLANNN